MRFVVIPESADMKFGFGSQKVVVNEQCKHKDIDFVGQAQCCL